MSGSYVNTDGRSESLNTTAAHDTGLYDPNVHDNQIVALYDTDAAAHAARDSLVADGFPASTMQVVDRGAGSTVEGAGGSGAEQSFWGAIKSLFVPDDELSAYNHALHHGHAVLVVTPGAGMNRQRLIHALEATNPVDFDARLEEWRQSGYDPSGTTVPPAPSQAIGAAAGMAPTATDVEYAGTTAPKVGAAALNTVEGSIRPDTTAGRASPAGGPVQTGLSATGASGTANPAASYDASLTGTARASDGPDTIKVAEERLRVGKREVAQGAVRIRSYVVERPVEEQVRLHEEHIHIERRPVDRAAGPGDLDPFQDRTIEARATSEEPVVSKTARVVEEISLHKEASERTETVRDTVRHTEVNVEDTTRTDTLGTGGTTTNATPNAGSSGTNSPKT